MDSAAQRKVFAGAAMAALLAISQSAHSEMPAYAGHLDFGGIGTGAVTADSGPFGTPELWSFWTLNVPFTSESVPFSAPVTITVRRLVADLDPVIGVWLGQESDTANYFDMASDALTSTWYGMGDDELPANVGTGPGGDARVSFTATLPGTYVVAVADYAFNGSSGGELPYQITAAIPEPETYALMLAGLGLVGWAASRRRRSR